MKLNLSESFKAFKQDFINDKERKRSVSAYGTGIEFWDLSLSDINNKKQRLLNKILFLNYEL